MTNKPEKPIFLFNSSGDWGGTVIGGRIFGPRGDYLGFVEGTAVYTKDGEWVGDLAKDGRILRKRSARSRPLHANPPPKPPKPTGLPARAPLPPQTVDVGHDVIDILEEDPDIFKRVSDRRPDMD